MQIIAQCPVCGCHNVLDDSATDKRIRCQKCQKLFKVPKLKDVPKATRIIKKAKSRIYVDEKGKTFG